MDFALSAEHRDLAAVIRDVLTARTPETELHRHLAAGTADRRGWADLVGIGVPGLAVAEELGGAGAGLTEVGVVFGELGRVLAVGPYLSSIGLATPALAAADDIGLLTALAAGERTATLAVRTDEGIWDPLHPGVSVRHDSDVATLSGVTSFVLDGAAADVLLVVAAGRDGSGLYAVERTASGVRTESLDVLDPTRPQARVVLDGAPGRLIGTADGAGPLVARARVVGSVLLAAEAVGAAERVLESVVDHASSRHQFGRPIGSFQAVKHQCADMLLRLEAARAASLHALWAADHAPDRLDEAAAVAASYCAETATFAAERGVQLHGGIGFTWEHPAHLYLRRARSAQQLLGSPRDHRAELADLVGL